MTSATKLSLALAVSSFWALVSLLILLKVLTSHQPLRTVAAAGGFIIATGLVVALLVNASKYK